jgi:hypothetical protein
MIRLAVNVAGRRAPLPAGGNRAAPAIVVAAMQTG